MDKIIKLTDLNYIYSPGTPFEWQALKNINIEIEKGEFLGIIGHTGSGKSTLISHLNGILKPTTGKILIDGEDIWNLKDKKNIRFKVGLVFQYPEYQLFEETIYKDIAFGPYNMGLSKEEVHERVLYSLKFVGLDESILEKSPFEISGGQKRRVAIAGVIAMKPQILILDEPTAGLDPRGRDEILMNIKEYHKAEGRTVILVSHSMEDIAKTVNKVLVMNKSEVFMFDTVAKIFERASELYDVGLAIPQITRIFLDLKNKGYDVDTSIFNIEDALKEIERAKKAVANNA
ncbi:MAG: energy-coupling factor transporter ATPase [Clostridia bacterium]